MSITGQTLKDAGGALFSQIAAADQTRVNRALVTRTIAIPFTDAATAGTTIGDSPIMYVDHAQGIRVTGVKVQFGVATTASDTVYATVTLSQHKAAAVATPVTIATANTSIAVGNFLGTTIGFTPYTVPLTATTANTVVAFGDSLSFGLAKLSTGTALTAAAGTAGQSCMLLVTYEEL